MRYSFFGRTTLACFAIVATTIFSGCTRQTYTEPHLLIETSLGDVEVKLFDKQAPKTSAAFLNLVQKGVYDNTSFYRVLRDDGLEEAYNRGVAQGGVFEAKPELAETFPAIPFESTTQTGLSHTNGTLSMARNIPGAATSEFFICIGNQSLLDARNSGDSATAGYAAFGTVVTGMKVVRKIQSRELNGDRLVTPIKILKIKRL